MKRYIAFRGEVYYPLGGWDDYAGTSDDLDNELVEQIVERFGEDIWDFDDYWWFDVLDTQTWQLISDEQKQRVHDMIKSSLQEKIKEYDAKQQVKAP